MANRCPAVVPTPRQGDAFCFPYAALTGSGLIVARTTSSQPVAEWPNAASCRACRARRLVFFGLHYMGEAVRELCKEKEKKGRDPANEGSAISSKRAAHLAMCPARQQNRLVPITGSSPVMEVMREQAARVASTDFTVLIKGSIDPVRLSVVPRQRPHATR